MLAGRKVPVTPTLSGKRSKEYIEALISQLPPRVFADLCNEVLGSDRKVA